MEEGGGKVQAIGTGYLEEIIRCVAGGERVREDRKREHLLQYLSKA